MHTPYLAHSSQERQEMLTQIGYQSVTELFAPIPAALQDFEMDLPQPLSELELHQELSAMAAKNTGITQANSFLGAGAYRHYLPASLGTLGSRSEFLTAYTPYQAEISQGTLQTIFEFQSALCTLTGLDIANASNYEGATSAVEALSMACRITRRQQVFVSPTLHPEYREVLASYAQPLDYQLHSAPAQQGSLDLASLPELEQPAALIVQYPNFLGQIEDLQAQADWIHERGGLLVVIINDPVCLGLLEAPGVLGADIVAGEAQAFGNAVSFGGPYLGFITAREKYLRQMPGRMCGVAEDNTGKTAYTLVLQTREQHIRREKATSNICTNQGLNALQATIWLSLIGKTGLQEMANICFQRAHYAAQRLSQIPGWKLSYPGPFFHEFVLEFEQPIATIVQALHQEQTAPGVPLARWFPELDRHLLINLTEMNPVSAIDQLVEKLTALSKA